MTTQLRRTRRLRGSRTHGWGRSGQHRGSGSQGGHGNAGWKRHKWSSVIRYGIQVNKHGFKRPNQKPVRAINIADLQEQIEKLTRNGHAKETDGKLEINLAQAGYHKLLGEGKVDKPYRIIIRHSSETANQKVTGAGGEIISPVKQKEE